MKLLGGVTRLAVLGLGGLVALPGMVSRAESQQSVSAPHVQVRLQLSRSAVAPGQALEAALEFVPEAGWHTYWKNAGDIGFGPKIEWTLPEGWRPGAALFETPERVSSSGKYINFGYERPSVVGTELRLSESAEPGETQEIQVSARWLVCRDVCVPGRAVLKTQVHVVPAGGTSDSEPIPESIRSSRLRRPEPWPAGWEMNLAAAQPEGSTWTLSLSALGQVPLPDLKGKVEFFPSKKGLLKTTSKIEKISNGGEVGQKRIDFQVEPESGALPPGTVDGVLKIGSRSWERSKDEGELKGGALAERASSRFEPLDFLTALPAAFFGGVLLNLMPCVFPVLWLKVLSFMQSARNSRRRRLVDALGYAFGIVISFLVLAGVLMALRSGGQSLGWGFQLQSPGFVLIVAALFFLISLNLLGVFEIGAEASGWVAGRFSRGKSGRSSDAESTFASSMGTGVLAVIVATPCTAPFMGSALGFALTGPTGLGLLVFASLGLGLAFPYIMLSIWPGMGRLLPKPGRWMETFKRVLSIPMLLTVTWLVWVLSLQRGSWGVGIFLALAVLMGLGAWWFGVLQRNPQSVRWASVGVFVLLLSGIGAAAKGIQVVSGPHGIRDAGESSQTPGDWQPWSPEAESQARSQGPVFIDFTAAWCVTCQVNEAAALNRRGVREAFRERRVLLMKADWTDEDPRITRALAAYGRTGVPLYVLIPFNGMPILLPQVLSPSLLLKELERIPRQK